MTLESTGIPYLTQLDDDIWTGGQPSPQQFEQAKAAGLKSVINLCPAGECGWDQQALMAQIDLPYVCIPVAAATDLSPENAKILADALESAPKPTLVHCASSNRVGALFALKAHLVDGADPSDALTHGHAAGLKGLEGTVRHMLGL
ncbi:sulfur transferase domain-containing protein [uncultured Abyssibacter sp.]|uniref:beta-lactamase hydrolase domain-containing protein n=1 Tax=uncultured Abyssibacter sp. TaxID=2320202 RepID=UPI0032B23950